MTSRREFLEAAALTAAIAGAPLARAATVEKSPERAGSPAGLDPAFQLMLFDARYSHARSAAGRVGRTGAALHALSDGDITQVWLDHVGPAWQRERIAIAGLTARPALFCLEQFAVSSGLRVVFHAEHIVHADGRTEHALLRGAQSVGLSASDLANADRRWPSRIADALAAYRPRAARPRFGRSNAALEPALPPQAQLLTSWIIAAA